MTSIALQRHAAFSSSTKSLIGKQIRLFSLSPVNIDSQAKQKEEQQKRSFASLQPPAQAIYVDSGLKKRFSVMAEVTISKIFPAGFGWQTASIAASELGYASDTLGFACITGAGDGVGVLGGHMAYFAIKKALVDSSIDMTKQLHTGILLGCAAFCSGTAWQPVVNVLQGLNLPFSGVFTGTWLACGTAFYVGLRASRTVLSGVLEHVHEPTYENSTRDAGLSLAIGGATGFFVGTDAVYLPDQNFLIDIVGITEGTSALAGCAIAGSSTSLGFATSQTAFNFMYPPGKNWID